MGGTGNDNAEELLMPVKAQCPYCLTIFSVPREKIGLKAKCSKCSASFRLSAMPDDRLDIGERQARAEFIEVRGPFGLPRWASPVAAIVLFLIAMGFVIHYWTQFTSQRQLGPSKEVSDKIYEARKCYENGDLIMAIARYRDARAMATGLGVSGEEVRKLINQELEQAQKDSRRPVILMGLKTAKSIDALPQGPELGETQRLRSAPGTRAEPEADDDELLIMVKCCIDMEKAPPFTKFRGDDAIEFKADEFTAYDRDDGTHKAVGFKMQDNYLHSRLIIQPPLKDQTFATIGVVFLVPAETELHHIIHKDLRSSAIPEFKTLGKPRD